MLVDDSGDFSYDLITTPAISQFFSAHLRLHHRHPGLKPHCDMARAVAASLTETRLDFANSVSLLIGTSNSNYL